MPSRNLLRAFMLLWWTAGLLLLLASLQTVRGGLQAGHAPVVWLAAVEAVSAGLFLFPRTLRVGAAGLLLTLCVAFVAHLHQFRWDFIFYAATVYFVAVHGPLSKPQWRDAASFG
jgi:hypothetical protein